MPLFADGLKKIRGNLEQIQNGERPKMVKIGVFTSDQLTYINQQRAEEELAPIEAVIVFIAAIPRILGLRFSGRAIVGHNNPDAARGNNDISAKEF